MMRIDTATSSGRPVPEKTADSSNNPLTSKLKSPEVLHSPWTYDGGWVKLKRDPQGVLRGRIKELSESRPRWRYRRIHILLLREG